jgi:hypothetical protein
MNGAWRLHIAAPSFMRALGGLRFRFCAAERRSCRNFYPRRWFIRPISQQAESPNAPTAQNGRASAAASATTEPPTSGYVLVVDGQMKAEFKMKDGALKAARDLKSRIPRLQVKVYDAEEKRSEEIELPAA